LARFISCLNGAVVNKYDEKEQKNAFLATIEDLQNLKSTHSSSKTALPAAAVGTEVVHETRSGSKRKSKSSDVDDKPSPKETEADIYRELKNVEFLFSQASLLNLSQQGEAPGVEILAMAALAAAAVAVTCISTTQNPQIVSLAMRIVTKALNLVVSAAAAPLPTATSFERMQFLEALLTAIHALEPNEDDSIIAENVRESMKSAIKKLCLDLFNGSSGDGSGSGNASKDQPTVLLKWMEETLSSVNISVSFAVLLEGVLAACEEVLVVDSSPPPSSSFSSNRGEGEGEGFAISLVACFESHVPSVSAMLLEIPENFLDWWQIRNSLAASAAHVIRIRCLAPSAIAEKLEKLPADQNVLLSRMDQDLASLANTLTGFELTDTPISGFLSYLEAACLATCAMKPAATAEHFATLLCLILHILASLPVDSEELDPVRRIIPLFAAFPAARTSPTSPFSSMGEARAAALGALQTLLAGSNSQQLRDVVAFVEKTLSTSTMYLNPYLLPITELSLMALEASRGKAALTMLAQRAERLASALTSTLYTAACPLPQKSGSFNGRSSGSDDDGMRSFAALYAAFLNNNNSNDGNLPSSWVTRRVSTPNSTSTSSHTTTSQVVACSTALRALESIVARPKLFVLSSRHLARILNFIDILGKGDSGGSVVGAFNPATASVYVNVCHLLTAFARHRESELGRCLPLFSHAVRALLTVLVKWEASYYKNDGHSDSVRVYCAEALSAVMAEIANLKVRKTFKI
jgi:hypothetical protein